MRPAVLLAALLFALAPARALAADEPPVVAFEGVTVLDGAGERQDDATVVVRDGKIAAVGGAVPAGASRFSAPGAFVTPGLIDAASRAGFDGYDAESTRELTAQVDVADLVDPRSDAFRAAAEAGCTTVYVLPGPRNVVGGLALAFSTRTAKGRAEPIEGAQRALQVTLASDASRGNFPPRYGATTSIYARRPTTRMGVVWMLRQVFLAAKGVQEPPGDADLTRYREVLDGTRPVRVLAHRNQDIVALLRIADEAGFAPVIEGAEEAFLSREELARRDVPVILGPFPDETSGGGPDRSDTALGAARLLHAAGVRVALTAGASGGRRLRDQMAYAVRYGMPSEAALAAVTSRAAALCGLKDRGRVKTGLVADLVLWSGDPFLPSSRPLVVVVRGRVVVDRTRAAEGGAR